MKEITIIIYVLIFIIWLAGAIASFTQLQQFYWRHSKLMEKIVIALVWPIDFLLSCWTLLKWIKRNITGR